MKIRIVTGTVALLAMLGPIPANAGDQGSNWEGAYTGLEVGYGWGQTKTTYGSTGAPLIDQGGRAKLGGAVVGGYLGYNWLIGSGWVLGGEGNVNWTDFGGNGNVAGAPNSVNQHYEASLRGRLGVLATPSFLLYTTAGFSFADNRITATNSPTETHSTTFTGWTVGIGSEWEIDLQMAIRLQYRYSDYGTERLPFLAHHYDIGVTPLINSVSVGIEYRL